VSPRPSLHTVFDTTTKDVEYNMQGIGCGMGFYLSSSGLHNSHSSSLLQNGNNLFEVKEQREKQGEGDVASEKRRD
jgi:hypothetical protein